MERKSSIFREEAIASRAARARHADVLRTNAPWTNWAYALWLLGLAATLVGSAFITLDENAIGRAVVWLDTSTSAAETLTPSPMLVGVFPAWQRSRLAIGQALVFQSDDLRPTGATLRIDRIGEPLDRSEIRRLYGIDPSASAGPMVPVFALLPIEEAKLRPGTVGRAATHLAEVSVLHAVAPEAARPW